MAAAQLLKVCGTQIEAGNEKLVGKFDKTETFWLEAEATLETDGAAPLKRGGAELPIPKFPKAKIPSPITTTRKIIIKYFLFI